MAHAATGGVDLRRPLLYTASIAEAWERNGGMREDTAFYPPVDPVQAGLKGRCPRCGEGRLFKGFLAVGDHCGNCGLDYSYADAGDGPAVFVILIIGFVVVGLALWMEITYGPPLWLQFLLWTPLTLFLSLTSLRLIKGVLLTLQYANKAREGRVDHPE